MDNCKTCGGARERRTTVTDRYGTHIDIEPCPDCTPPLLSCRNGHRAVTFHGEPCPVCELNAKLAARTKGGSS